MALIINDFLQFLSAKEKSIVSRVVSSDPANGLFNGEIIVNTSTNEFKIWYSSTWNTIGITITPGAVSYVLLETGDFFLLETGDKLVKG